MILIAAIIGWSITLILIVYSLYMRSTVCSLYHELHVLQLREHYMLSKPGPASQASRKENQTKGGGKNVS